MSKYEPSKRPEELSGWSRARSQSGDRPCNQTPDIKEGSGDAATSLPPGGGRKGGAEDRIKKYKAGVDLDDSRRRREEDLVGIRKNKRGDSLAKKRRGVSAENCASPASDGVHALAADCHPSAPDACLLHHVAKPP